LLLLYDFMLCIFLAFLKQKVIFYFEGLVMLRLPKCGMPLYAGASCAYADRIHHPRE
jgi:hypothetical protein